MHGGLCAAQLPRNLEGILKPVREADRERAVRRLNTPGQEGYDAPVPRPHRTAQGFRATSEPQHSSGNGFVVYRKGYVPKFLYKLTDGRTGVSAAQVRARVPTAADACPEEALQEVYVRLEGERQCWEPAEGLRGVLQDMEPPRRAALLSE